MSLEKVKEALNEAIDTWAGDPEAGNLEVKIYKEALEELNTFIARLESEELVEEVTKTLYPFPESLMKIDKVRAAINIIKGEDYE